MRRMPISKGDIVVVYFNDVPKLIGFVIDQCIRQYKVYVFETQNSLWCESYQLERF